MFVKKKQKQIDKTIKNMHFKKIILYAQNLQ